MFFSADDEDQDFLSSGGGSKLASLFGGGSQGGNESLTYTAPKQPKKAEPAGQSSAAPQLLFATAVQAYKYVDGKYANQGKLGAAVLGSYSSQSYRVLLYVTKSQQVSNATISPTFSYTVQPNNYGSFYDDQRQTWSLMFDTEANAVQFAKHIALSKANSAGGELSTLVSQDLQLGDGTAVDTGDMVEVKYTGWLLSSHTFGQEFDSNVKADKLFRFKIGSGKVIKAWDQGVVGMKKGSKRLLVVPPSLGYGSQGAGSRIPPNSTLIFEIEIVRVKLAKSSEPQSQSPAPIVDTSQHSTTSSQPSTTPSPADELEDNQTVKGRTKSLTEHMTQGGSSNKAKLISRMAKMGQPMLPMAGAVPAQPDSEEEVVMESPQPVADTPAQPTHSTTNPIVTKPVPQHPRQPAMQPVVQPVQMMQQQPAFLQNIPAAQQLSVYQPQMLQQGMMPPGAQNGFQPTSTYQGQPQQVVGGMQQPMYTGMPMMNQTGESGLLLTETRQQNTELRLSVGKMQDKMDQLLEKVDILHKKGPMALESSMPSMESAVLMHNIQRIVQENERLKKEGYDKSAKIERQNEKISELLQSNQMYVEKSQNLLEQRNEGFITTASQSQAKVLALEQEKVDLATRLSTVTAQLGDTQLQLATIREKELAAQQKLGSSDQDVKKRQKEIQAMKSQHEEDETKIAELSQDLKQEKQRRKDLDSKFSELQEEFTDIKSTNETLQKNLSDRKRKAAEEKRRMEDEFEETKINFEQEIQSLRDKLRKQKSSTDVVAAEQVSQVEEELTKEWKEKCDRLLSAANDKHNRALQAMKEEKEEIEEKVAVLQNRIETMKRDNTSGDVKHKELEEQVEEMSAWKSKYDSLRSQAASMKEKYEARIEELENENEELETEKETAEERIQSLQRELANRPVGSPEGSTNQPVGSPGGSTTPAGDVTTEVKKIMNSVYQQLRSKFEDDNSYPGDEVLAAILGVIKETTIKLVQQGSSSKGNDDEEEDEEEEEEDEEEEDSDDNDEDSGEEENQEQKEEIHDTNANQEEKPGNVSPVTVNSDNVPDRKEETNADPAEVEPSPQESLEEPQPTENSPLQSSLPSPGEEITENTPMGREPDKGDVEPDKEEVKDQIPTENTLANSEPDKDENQTPPVKAAQNKYDDFEVPAIVSREPPPDVEDEDSTESEKMEENNDPLFGDDDNVADTFGDTVQTPKEDQNKKKKPEAKDLLEDDDSKQPPPPLFPDDDDDDDLDWLS